MKSELNFNTIFNRKKNVVDDEKVENRFLEEWVNPILGTFKLNQSTSYSDTKALKLSTVYRCVNLIGDSIASLPLIPYYYKEDWKYINYDNNIFNLLNIQPNEFMGKFTFFKMLITNVLLKGNGYIYIDRLKNGRVQYLELLDSDDISVIIENNDLKYRSKKKKRDFDKSQIIHILNYTYSGYIGVSTINHAATTLGISYNSDQHSSNFFKGGANLSGILRPLPGVNVTSKKATDAKQNFLNALSSELNGESGSIVVLDSGLEYQPITVNPKDSQLLESRQFNVIDICRFFNVPPALAFSETGKFSTAEQQQLDYLNNTITPILEKIENEFFRKLYLPSEFDNNELKFDVENLLRLDATTKADYYTKMYQIGGYTTNEIRNKLNSPFPVKGGNRAFIQVNLQPLDNLIAENGDNGKQIDNKLKNNNSENGNE